MTSKPHTPAAVGAYSLSHPAEPAPPSPINAWWAVLSVALGAAVFCTTEFLPVGLLRYIVQGLGVSEGVAGTMVTVPGLLAAVAAPFLTVAVGNHDRRRVLLSLGALLVAANLIAMLAPNFAVVIVGRVLFGIGLGGFWAIGAGLAGRLVEQKSTARATALIFAGVSVGMLVGGAAGAFIGHTFGWRAAFGAAAVLSSIALLAQFAWLPALRVPQSIQPRDLLAIVATPVGRVGLIAMAITLYGQFATYTYITPFLANQTGFDGKAISSILLGYTLIGLLGNFLGGMGAGRNVKLTLSATIALFSAAVLLLPVFAEAKATTLALLTVWGLAYGAMPIALQTWMVRAAPNAHEGGMALFVANFQTSIALGSFIGGAAVDNFGTPSAMALGGILGGVALAVLWILPAGRRSFSS